jgi:hypothetical protein
MRFLPQSFSHLQIAPTGIVEDWGGFEKLVAKRHVECGDGSLPASYDILTIATAIVGDSAHK